MPESKGVTMNTVEANDTHAALTSAQQKVGQLEARKTAITASLRGTLSRIESGSATSAETESAPALARQSSAIASELQTAHEVLKRAEERQARSIAESRMREFNEHCEAAKKVLTVLHKAVAESCLSLGEYFAHVSAARALFAQLSNASNFQTGVTPEMRAQLAELGENPNPISALLDSGFRPISDLGWLWSITITPMTKSQGGQ